MLRILHISDLHIGKEGQGAAGWRMRRVLGQAWLDNLHAIAKDGKPDIVCFTGDLAQAGKAGEYALASTFLDDCLQALGVGRDVLFVVPGNHDVDRSVQAEAWKKLRDAAWHNPAGLSQWLAGGKAPFGFDAAWRDAVLARQQAFRDWQRGFWPERHAAPSASLLGQRFSLRLKNIPLHLIGLDSAWLAGDENDHGKLRLTEDQIMHLLQDETGQVLPGLKVVLLHHPLSELADEERAQGLLRQCGVDLVLHGHVHKARQVRWQPLGEESDLLITAAGCLYERDTFPNSLRVLDLAWHEADGMHLRQIWQRCWSVEGHWHDDDAWHKDSRQGRLRFDSATPVAAPLQFFQAENHIFGRDDELAQLAQAFAVKQAKPVAICCSVEGMAGVGKSWLAAAFIRQSEWSGRFLRLALPEAQDMTTEDIARAVLDAERVAASAAGSVAALREYLLHGNRLLLIENVDSPAQAEQVAALMVGLQDCRLLLTARHREMGLSAYCRPVAVGPLAADAAIALLRAEAPRCKEDDAALLRLVAKLGGLALALHIAASHLNKDRSVAWFIAELERQVGFELGSADVVDAALRKAHEAERMILHPSFAISWQAWCKYASEAQVQALARLAHGPDGGCGASLGAAIAGLVPPDQVTREMDAGYEALVSEAGRWSLLSVVEEQGMLVRWHPLLQQWLRQKQAGCKAVAEQAWHGWLLARLPEPEDQSGEWVAWKQVQQEQAGLRQALQTCTQAEGRALGGVASDYAQTTGPFALWQSFAERMLAGLADDDDARLKFYWIRGQCAKQVGDFAAAADAATQRKAFAAALGAQREVALAAGLLADLAEARGELDQALRIRREEELPVYEQLGDQRSRAVTMGQIADVLQARGELDQALRIRREEQLPVYEQLGDKRGRAVTMGKIADVLQARGELDEALRIHREEVLPVVEQLGDKRGRAVTMGKIADVLQVRGELDEALRIRREEQLPVYEQLGDKRSRAVTMGQIADVWQARGELDEALRIRREEELPVYEQLGDKRARAVTMGKIAEVLQERGELDEALRIRREEELPVYEQLGDKRELLVGKTNLALLLLQQSSEKTSPEALELLQQAHQAATELRIPEANQIEDILRQLFPAQAPTPT